MTGNSGVRFERAPSGSGRTEGPAGRLPARAVVCRDTAAEAAGTGGVGTAGALAKKLSSPMSHITKEDDLNVVQVDNEIRERSPANYFSAPDLLQNQA